MTEDAGPFYQRIADDIRARIISGEYQVGAPIPSTPKLEQQHGVSKTAVRQAVEQLRAEGILAGHPGKAVYVRAKPDEAAAGQRDVAALAAEVAELKRRVRDDDDLREIVSRIEDNLVELYGRTGHDYPHPREADGQQKRRARHG